MFQVKMKLVRSCASGIWLRCVVWLALFATNAHVTDAYGTHWWNPGNQNHQNHNQIGLYQDDGNGFRQPDHVFAHDSRIPKDIMVDVINNMGLALLEAHNENNDNNIAISPYGATSVMIALLEGLVGEAAYEIKMALQLPPDLSVVRIGLRDIHRHLKSYFIPKEGFLAGLTLSHDNITLNREYQSILKFYGYDIESFNNPAYPDISTTSSKPAITMTTGERRSNTTKPSETTTESTITDKLSTLSMEAKGTDDDDDDTTAITTEKITDSTTTQTSTIEITTETPSITRLPTPSEQDVEGTTTKRLPPRSYTTAAYIAVTGPKGRNETFYPMTTIEGSTEIITKSEEDTFQLRGVNSVTTTTIETVTNEELKATTETTGVEFKTEKLLDYSTLKMSDVTENGKGLKTTDGDFFEVTTYVSQRTNTDDTTTKEAFESTTLFGNIDKLVSRDTTDYQSQTQEDSTSSTTFEGTAFFALEITDFLESNSQAPSFTNSPSISTSFPLRNTTETDGTTETNDFVTLTERGNKIYSERNQKLTKLDNPTSTMISISEITAITTELITAYTQTQNTEASSLEDLALSSQTSQNSSFFKIDAKITSNNKFVQEKPKRQERSVVDYLIARYYDNYFINNNDNRRYIPTETRSTHYSNYQPEQPYTFLVNGKLKETNISFMTYDTILPFYYIRSLDAMALSFPLDSNMYYLLLVLPLDPNGIDKLVYNMRKATSLRDIVDKLAYTHVKAVIPSFMLKGYVVLTPSLQKLCIRKIFEPRHANFSPMTPERNLYVTNIEQAVTVTIRNYVDPASHSARNLNHYRPVEFRADHPFLYFVMDSQIHVNLMAGKIINPLNSRIR